jgi:hypothetical protein
VPAQPPVAGAGAPRLQAVMHGPPPSMLGIDPAQIPHAVNARELRARQLAHPSTALPLGARPPTPHVVRVSPGRAAPVRSFGAPARAGGGGRGRH